MHKRHGCWSRSLWDKANSRGQGCFYVSAKCCGPCQAISDWYVGSRGSRQHLIWFSLIETGLGRRGASALIIVSRRLNSVIGMDVTLIALESSQMSPIDGAKSPSMLQRANSIHPDSDKVTTLTQLLTSKWRRYAIISRSQRHSLTSGNCCALSGE